MNHNRFKIFLILFCLFFRGISQNLISNSSFSNIKNTGKKSLYEISKIQTSDVNGWYIPDYVKLNYRKPSAMNCKYYSSREKELIPQKRSYYHANKDFNSDQLFDNNLGFIELNIFTYMIKERPIVQQKLLSKVEKGLYCLKFNYKSLRYMSSYQSNKVVSLDFSISKTDLKEYYDKMNFPENLLQVRFKDTINNPFSDQNSPWQKACYKIYLNGDEKYLTFGSLKIDEVYPWGSFWIDDIELYKDTNECSCNPFNKDLTNSHKRDFLINHNYENDTLIAFAPVNLFVGIGIISPDAKLYLNDIISFMQRNKEINIQFFEKSFYDKSPPSYYTTFRNYIVFHGISPERITAIKEKCIGEKDFYCNSSSEYVQLGFKFK